jgi:hypothetical protein
MQLLYNLMGDVITLMLKLSDASYLLGDICVILQEAGQLFGGCSHIGYTFLKKVKEFGLPGYYGESSQGSPLEDNEYGQMNGF